MDFQNEQDPKKNKFINEILFFRQFFSCSVVVLNIFIFGLYMGAITVIVPQLRKEANSTNAVTPEMTSWLSSISLYTATPWSFLLPMLTYHFGRKPGLILISINVLIGNTLFYCSNNVTELIISQAILGMPISSVLTVDIMVLSEYTSPKYRGIIMTMKSATFFWGIWISNAIGTYFHWKNIGIVIFVCSIYNLISSIIGCESPFWLATKGRYAECAKVHRWLKGTDEKSEEELKKLITLQREKSRNKTEVNRQLKAKKRITILNIVRRKSFYMPLLYSCLPVFLYTATGKIAYTVYAIDVIKKITSSERMAYEGMLILDAVTVLGMYLGCALSKFITRRKQLLFFSSAGISFLYGLSIYLYIIKFDVVSGNNYISLVLLVGFTISIGCGPIILAPCCTAELAPLRNRSYFLCCMSFLDSIIFASNLKLTPFVFELCGTPGAFLFYGVCSSVAIIVFYKYMPETKDRTIQEIEDHITKGIPYDNRGTTKTEAIPLQGPEFN